jgi:hypothetical protein
MDYEDVVYVDGRNAVTRPVVITQGTRPPRPPTTGFAPSPREVAMATGAPYQYQYPVSQAAYYGPAAMPSWASYPMNPGYAYPPVAPSSNLASILGGFGDIGSLANIVAQAFAAFLPLPASPTPQDGTDNDTIATNTLANSSNLIRYQNALAQFARRDQQILTLGSVLKELFKRPGPVG